MVPERNINFSYKPEIIKFMISERQMQIIKNNKQKLRDLKCTLDKIYDSVI